MVSVNTAKNGLSISTIYPCGICGLRVKVNSVVCIEDVNEFIVDSKQ